MTLDKAIEDVLHAMDDLPPKLRPSVAKVVAAARNRCVMEASLDGQTVRYEAPTVEELDRLRLIGSGDLSPDIIPLTVAG